MGGPIDSSTPDATFATGVGSMAAFATMAKPKRGPGRPKGEVARETIISLKGFPEFKTWLDEFAEYCNLSMADTVGQALLEYAKLRGFRSPPKR
jgi:hypothetical protein